MPLVTLSHCVVCFKQDPVTENGKLLENKRVKSEICRRFCSLSSRLLDLDPFHFMPEKTINSKQSVSCEFVCSGCFVEMKKFCDFYEQYDALKLQLNISANRIATLMIDADNKNKGEKDMLDKKLTTIGSTMEDIIDFRSNFVECVKDEKLRSFPRVSIKRPATTTRESVTSQNTKTLIESSKSVARRSAERAKDLNLSCRVVDLPMGEIAVTRPVSESEKSRPSKVHGRFKCRTCTETFSHLQSVYVHERRVHEGIKYQCSDCDYRRNSKGLIWTHLVTFHEMEHREAAMQCNVTIIKCSQCKCFFLADRQFDKHARAEHVEVAEKLISARKQHCIVSRKYYQLNKKSHQIQIVNNE